MQIVKKIAPLILIIFFLYACEDKYSTLKSFNITAAGRSATADTIIKDSINNFYFSRLRYPNTGGLSATYTLTPEHQNKRLYVVVSGRARTNYAQSNAAIVFTAYDDREELLLWHALSLQYYFTDINKWCAFKDSLFFHPAVKNKYYGKISVVAYLGNATNERFDIDTLKVEIKEKIN